MTCKYFDCGFCYAPENVKTNATQGGCFEPEYCPYVTESKTLMTEKEHLECEIKELELEIEQHGKAIQNLINVQERRKQKLKEMNDTQRNTNEAVENKQKELINKLENKNWNVNINHRTPYKPQVEYYDEQTVIINGVQYQRVEPPKPPTLYDALCEKGNMYSSVCDTVVEIVKEWMPDEVEVDTEEYNLGWNACLQHLKENLK